MKKLKLAIIGQGRSGKNIHGKYYLSKDNQYFEVKYVIDADAHRRSVAEQMYPNCKVFADYQALFAFDDIDLVVNATYSEQHYPITKDLLLHGKNVLVEKPLARTRYECDELIKIAHDKGVTLAVFQRPLNRADWAEASARDKLYPTLLGGCTVAPAVPTVIM